MLQLTPVPWTLLGLPDDFALDHLELRLLAPTAAHGHDGGVVENFATIDYDTGESIAGGLFDQSIFGALDRDPSGTGDVRADLQREHKRLPRERQLSFPEPRRDRFGCIELAAPMLHPAVLIGDPRWLERGTGLSAKQLRLLNAEHVSLVVKSAGQPAVGSVVDSIDRHELDASEVVLETGAEAIRGLLQRRGEPLDPVIERVRAVPVLLRPIVPSQSDRFWVADLNHIYERLVMRNFLLASLEVEETPDFVFATQRALVMQTLEQLYRNHACEHPLRDTHERVVDGLLELAGGPELGERLRRIEASVPEPGFEEVMPWEELVTRRCLQAVGFELVRKG